MILKPCPFCGGTPDFERTGTHRRSCIVACADCGCKHESSDEFERSGESWNMRMVPEEGMREALDSLQACASSVLAGYGDRFKNSLYIDLDTAIKNALRILQSGMNKERL